MHLPRSSSAGLLYYALLLFVFSLQTLLRIQFPSCSAEASPSKNRRREASAFMSSKRELLLLTEDTESNTIMLLEGFLIYFYSCFMRTLDRKQSPSSSAEASPFKNRRLKSVALVWGKLLLPVYIEVLACEYNVATIFLLRLLCFDEVMILLGNIFFFFSVQSLPQKQSPSSSSAEAWPSLVAEVGVAALDTVSSSPVSRSPSNLDSVPLRSSFSPALLPHPLPLPENSHGNGECALPSPPKGDAVEEGSGSAADHWANLLRPACYNTQKSPEPIDPPSKGWNFSSLRKAIHDPNSVESITFRLNIPAKSAKSQWQKLKRIGSGAYGNVYKAVNRHTGALCAMKEVNIIPDSPKSAERLKQLEQEIRVLSKLKHPNIVQYYGSELTEDRFFIYLEYVYPGSINKYVQEHCGAMTESVVRNFTHHILKGLAYLHSTDNIHRDIKGANLLVDANGVVKLADFGTAKLLSGAAPAFSFKGTVYWMAPEVVQATMTKDVGYDFAVDIWSLGCTIIEMFTGKHPWSGLEGVAAMFNVLHKDPPIPETLSSEGKDFLQRCFRRNPAERPTANMLLDHPFIRNSNHYNLHGSIQAFAGIKLNSYQEDVCYHSMGECKEGSNRS